MNGAAANSLLKILEEPPHLYILYWFHQDHAFSCRPSEAAVGRLLFAPPDPDTAQRILSDSGCGKQSARYLGLAGGAPLRVAQWMKDEMLGRSTA
jgi:hypothetical protein